MIQDMIELLVIGQSIGSVESSHAIVIRLGTTTGVRRSVADR